MKDIKVCAALIEHQGKFLIAERPQGDPLAGLWEFPGGKIESSETPQEALQRELAEEFNIDVVIGDWWMTTCYQYPTKLIQLIAYRVRWISGEFQIQAHNQIKWITPSEVSQYVFAPADQDMADALKGQHFQHG